MGLHILSANARFDCSNGFRFPANNRYEIFNGEYRLISAPDTLHQRISIRLSAALLRQLDDFGTVLEAPCDVRLSRQDIVQPDILFIRKERNGIIGERHIQGSPDLIIEILSQNTRKKDLAVKRSLYSRFGVQEYWIVDPDHGTVEVLAWCEIGYVLAGVYSKSGNLSSPFLPGLKVPLSEIFKKSAPGRS